MGGQIDFIAEAKTAFPFLGGGGVGVGERGAYYYTQIQVKLKLSESTTLGIYEGSRN